ncbi:hypothetical protein ACWG0P_06415 [Amedibacillus sp. YH-ame6]
MEVRGAPISFMIMVEQHSICICMEFIHREDEKEIDIYLEPLFT